MTQLSLEVDKFCCPLLLMLTLSCTPFPLPPLSVSVSVPPCAVYLALSSLPFELIIIVFGFVFIATVVVAVSGAWQFIALAIAVHIQPSIRLSIHQPSGQPSNQATIHPTAYLLNLCTSLRRCRRFGKLHFDWPASSLAVNYISPTPEGGRCREWGAVLVIVININIQYKKLMNAASA